MQTAEKYPLEHQMEPLPAQSTMGPQQAALPIREITTTSVGLFLILSIIQYNLSHVPYSETQKLYTNLGVAVTRTLDPNRN